ncbi:MAG: 3-hydroxyisobutyrate dehydrogenase [Rhodospirillales bacterium]|nr:3-hydroxyisobutyrate dehydrogenase [Rhodospirillales bacterium]
MARIGFIGLGNMGGPMAANLARAGHEVAGFDLKDDAMERAAGTGVAPATTARAAAGGAEAVVTMLPAGQQLRDLYLGEGGLLAAVSADSLLIDSSTVDLASARAVHAAAAAAGRIFVDAPVSGGVAGAEQAALTFMCGGSEAAFARAKPLLEAMGRSVVHAGGAGNGQAAKLCNNMLLGISMLGVCEAFVLAEKLGLDPQALFDIASKSSGSCWAMLNHLPLPGIVEGAAANRDYRPGFAANLMLKDLRLSQEAALQAAAATPLAAAAAALFGMFVNAGNGDLDYSAIVKMVRGH